MSEEDFIWGEVFMQLILFNMINKPLQSFTSIMKCYKHEKQISFINKYKIPTHVIRISQYKAQKNYTCYWCGEDIKKNNLYTYRFSKCSCKIFDIRSLRFHIECWNQILDNELQNYDIKITGGYFKRGTLDFRKCL